jgi:hypothetical protein
MAIDVDGMCPLCMRKRIEVLENKLVPKFTKSLPKKEGYYWFTDGGLLVGTHTPTILKVKKEEGKFLASNEEFGFAIAKPKKGSNPEFWCFISEPILRDKDGKIKIS